MVSGRQFMNGRVPKTNERREGEHLFFSHDFEAPSSDVSVGGTVDKPVACGPRGTTKQRREGTLCRWCGPDFMSHSCRAVGKPTSCGQRIEVPYSVSVCRHLLLEYPSLAYFFQRTKLCVAVCIRQILAVGVFGVFALLCGFVRVRKHDVCFFLSFFTRRLGALSFIVSHTSPECAAATTNFSL